MPDQPAKSPSASPSPVWRRLVRRDALRVVLGIVLLLLFTLFVVENARTVRIRFFFFTTSTWLAWALVLAGVLGVLVGLLLPRLRRFL